MLACCYLLPLSSFLLLALCVHLLPPSLEAAKPCGKKKEEGYVFGWADPKGKQRKAKEITAFYEICNSRKFSFEKSEITAAAVVVKANGYLMSYSPT